MKKLSKLERITLINQYEILNHINPSSTYEQHIEALKSGFTHFYADIVDSLSNEVSDEVQKFTIDVLNMYRAMHNFSLNAKDEKLLASVVFEGFDSTTEFEYWDLSNFLLCKLNRFKEIKDNKGDDDFNTHGSSIYAYERQLNIWKNLGQPHWEKITKTNILDILKA